MCWRLHWEISAVPVTYNDFGLWILARWLKRQTPILWNRCIYKPLLIAEGSNRPDADWKPNSNERERWIWHFSIEMDHKGRCQCLELWMTNISPHKGTIMQDGLAQDCSKPSALAVPIPIKRCICNESPVLTSSYGYKNPIINLRRPSGRLKFVMRIPIPTK